VEVVLAAEEQSFARQHQRMFASRSAQDVKNYGAVLADKYRGRKSVRFYTDTEVQNVVKAYKEKVRRQAAGLVVLEEGGAVEDSLSSDHDDDDEEELFGEDQGQGDAGKQGADRRAGANVQEEQAKVVENQVAMQLVLAPPVHERGPRRLPR
jgi:hypothetical protein